MTLSYSLRLMCLSLATFVAVLTIATVAVRVFTDRALRRVEAMPASSAARFLFTMRMLPAALALASVVFFCVPSYLWFEPDAAGEEAGAVALIAAGIGAALVILGIARALWALLQTAGSIARWESPDAERMIAGTKIIEVAQAGRMIALVGVWRPRLMVSKEAAAVLNGEQLAAAIEHEMAHAKSRDNVKQLMTLIAPGLLLGRIERGWKRFAEWAADDCAESPVDLAEALVRVARVSPGAMPPVLSTSLLRETADLSARVDRLLAGRKTATDHGMARWRLVIGAVGIMAIAPMTLAWVHGVLEHLMD